MLASKISGLAHPKSKEIWEKTNEFVEKSSKIGFHVLKYVFAPSYTLSKFFVSFFNYFTTDLGHDAFDLLLPMW